MIIEHKPEYDRRPPSQPVGKTLAIITFAAATAFSAVPIIDAGLNFFKRAEACKQVVGENSNLDLKKSWVRIPSENTPSHLNAFKFPLLCAKGKPSGYSPS